MTVPETASFRPLRKPWLCPDCEVRWYNYEAEPCWACGTLAVPCDATIILQPMHWTSVETVPLVGAVL